PGRRSATPFRCSRRAPDRSTRTAPPQRGDALSCRTSGSFSSAFLSPNDRFVPSVTHRDRSASVGAQARNRFLAGSSGCYHLKEACTAKTIVSWEEAGTPALLSREEDKKGSSLERIGTVDRVL